MKKKILSLVLVVAMLASMLVFAPVSGATTADGTVKVTNASGYAGDTVAVDVVITTEHPIYKFQFAFDYDKSKMTLEDVEFAPGFGFWPIAADAAVDAVMAESPFDNIGWNRVNGADPIDASEGAVVATMYFTLNEDVLGGAYVSVVASPINNIAIDGGQPGDKIYNFEYVAGSVTALPAGYLDFDSADSDGFSFPNDKVAKPDPGPVDTYTGVSTGVVIVPETAKNKLNKQKAINGLETAVFVGTKFTTLIIPAHVETVAKMAIFDPAVEALSIYVMGDTQFADLAVYLDESPCQVTIYAKAGSAAAEYAVAEGHNYVPFTHYNLTVGESSYVVSSNVQAPGMTVIGDKTVIGWKAGAATYAPGAAMTLTEDTELTPVTIDAIKMNTGIQFQMGESIKDCKMRYTTDMKIADYNKLAELGTVTLGTIITPAKYVSMAGGLTKEALTQLAIDNAAKLGALKDGKTGAGLTYIDVPASAANPFGKTTDTYTFAGSLAGFKNENVNTKNVVYAAAFYATVTIDEETSFTIYSNFDLGANRSVDDAIKAMTGAGVEGQLTKTEADTLRDLIAKN